MIKKDLNIEVFFCALRHKDKNFLLAFYFILYMLEL